MRKLILLVVVLSSLHSFAQPVMRIFGGASLPRHSYMPPGPVPKLSRYPGYTFGFQLATPLTFSTYETDLSEGGNRSITALIGIDYTEKGGRVANTDGSKMQTRFTAPGLELGAMTNPRNSRWINAGLSLYAGYILNGERTLTSAAGIDSTFALKIGNGTDYDLRPVITGMKLHLMLTMFKKLNLGVTFQGSPVELSNNDTNLRDKGIQFTLGYYLMRKKE
jgi:hypothetical protein